MRYQKWIDRLKNTGLDVVIATDNDSAGQEVRDRNKDCVCLIPQLKDWNEDLIQRKTSISA